MGTRLVEQMRCNFTPYTEKEPHLTQQAPSKALPCPTCLGCKTESKVESTIKVSGSPTNSESTTRRKGSKKRLSRLTLRWNEEGCSPTTPGNRCEKNLSASRRNERSLSMPRNCPKRASAMTSESESLFMDS